MREGLKKLYSGPDATIEYEQFGIRVHTKLFIRNHGVAARIELLQILPNFVGSFLLDFSTGRRHFTPQECCQVLCIGSIIVLFFLFNRCAAVVL